MQLAIEKRIHLCIGGTQLACKSFYPRSNDFLARVRTRTYRDFSFFAVTSVTRDTCDSTYFTDFQCLTRGEQRQFVPHFV